MKAVLRIRIILFAFLIFLSAPSRAQDADTTMYLLTCGPGTEVYSIYGHSALLVEIQGRDTVYNWGVFDFGAPNFAWNFAKGKLDYMLGHERLGNFLESYFYEKRYVLSQKINLLPAEERLIMELINENLKPENVKYRYDFFYDDCSTRIRDLLEKALGNSLSYREVSGETRTYRDMITEYQQYYPWLQFGVDLLIGSNAEKVADVRGKMFLPEYLMSGLSAAVVNRDGKTVPLLNKPEILLDFDPPSVRRNFFTTPFFVFSMLLVLVIFLSLRLKLKVHLNMMDYFLFLIFSLLAIMMVFFNFFTDHEQLRANFNIIWLNPFLVILFIAILARKHDRFWARIVFFITVAFLLLHFFIPQAFHIANYPLLLILFVRTMGRSGFSWSPVKAGQNQ